MRSRTFIGLMVIGCVTVASAQDQPPPAEQVVVYEDVPNYAELLGHHLMGYPDVSDDWGSFGRLRDTGVRRTVTLSDCILMALQYNTDLKVERLAPLTARTGVLRALALFDPVLFSDISKIRSVEPPNSALISGVVQPTPGAAFIAPNIQQTQLTGKIGFRKVLRTGAQAELRFSNERVDNSFAFQRLDPYYATDLLLSLNQPLLRDFGLRYSTILVRVAQVQELQAVRRYEARVADIIKRVEDAYWSLVQAIENVRVQEQGLALAQELLRQNEGKVNVGTLPQTAVLEAQVDVASRESLLIRANNAALNARDTLRALLNVPQAEVEALLEIDPVELPSVERHPVDLDQSTRLARERRPELQAALLDVHAKTLVAQAAENQLLPKFGFAGAIGLNGLSGRPKTSTLLPGQAQAAPFSGGGGYEDSLNNLTDGRFYSYSAGLVLELPIGNAVARADYTSARIDVERARLEFQRAQQSVSLEVKTAVSNLESDLKSIQATRIARELSEQNLRNQKARYDVGLATTKDLLDFGDRLTVARAAEVQAITRYNIDLAELRRVEGTLLPARSVVLDVVRDDQTPWWARF